jgi:hypothetical protein
MREELEGARIAKAHGLKWRFGAFQKPPDMNDEDASLAVMRAEAEMELVRKEERAHAR